MNETPPPSLEGNEAHRSEVLYATPPNQSETSFHGGVWRVAKIRKLCFIEGLKGDERAAPLGTIQWLRSIV